MMNWYYKLKQKAGQDRQTERVPGGRKRTPGQHRHGGGLAWPFCVVLSTAGVGVVSTFPPV